MKKVLAIIAALAFILVGAIFLNSEVVDTSEDPGNLAELSCSELEENHIYYIEELCVLDAFATLEDDVLYLMVLYTDADDRQVVANMPVNPGAEIWDDVNDYLDDDSMGYGDMVLDCYVKAEEDINVQDKLHGYFSEYMNRVRSELKMPLSRTELRFEYVCDADGDPYEAANGANIVVKVMGVVSIAIGGLYLLSQFLRKRKKSRDCNN